MAVINTNYSSVIVQNDLMVTNRTLGSAMDQLSTGKRINSAVDDASGLSMSNSRAMQIKGLNQAMRNANDGVSMLQTADGALWQVNNILNRMRELAVQAGNDTNTSQDRYALDQEYQQLNREISRIATTTQWNGMHVLNSSEVGAPGRSSDVSAGVRNVKFHVGANANQYLNIGLKDFSYTLGVPATTSETKLTLGDMKDRQFFQITIQQDAINNGATTNRTISFDLNRPIAGTTMVEDELVEFETELARAINNSDGYTNVSVSRVGRDIYIKDAEGRSIGNWALTGGATAATANQQLRITESSAYGITPLSYRQTISPYLVEGGSYTVTLSNNTSASFTLGTPTLANFRTAFSGALNSINSGAYTVSTPGSYLQVDYGATGTSFISSVTASSVSGASVTSYDNYEKTFSVGDLTGKKYFSIGLGSSTYAFDYDFAAGSLTGFASAVQTQLNTSGNNYTVAAVGGNSLKVNWDWASPATLNIPTRLTGGSDTSTRSNTADYQGVVVSQGSVASAAGAPAATSVFSGTARLNDTRISTHAAATVAIGRIDAAMAAVDREQTTMGSVMNRLAHAGDNAGQISRNTTSSRSRLSDADYAAATTEVVRQQIIQQASMAMLAQATQVPNSVITLLK